MPPSDSSEAPNRSAPPEAAESVSAPDSEEEDRAILAQLTIGSVVDGKYRVDRVLGRGAMGVVLQATHVHLGEKVALKFLRYRAKSGTEDFQTRFKREARVSAKLRTSTSRASSTWASGKSASPTWSWTTWRAAISGS